MKQKKSLFYFFIILTAYFTLSSCGGGKVSYSPGEADTLKFHYTCNLQVVRLPKFTIATLRNPWDTTKTLHTYILVPKNKPLPDKLPKGTVIRIPVSKAVVYSSVHCSLILQLGAQEHIGGVCDLKYIKLPYIQKACQTGKIIDAGDGMNPDIEKIIDLHPDLIMLSPFENSGGYGRIEKLDIPIMECADYMENSALGRAEWMRFYGLLFGRESTADSLFTIVEKNYLALCRLTANVKFKPKVLDGEKDGATWYISNGDSPTGHIYADAGVTYTFADRRKNGFDPLSFEQVFDKAQDADIWFIKYNLTVDKTYKSMLQEYTPYGNFKAFKQHHIYGCNVNKVAYYEETTYHPDWLLQDIIVISHPELLPGKETRYYKPLKEE